MDCEVHRLVVQIPDKLLVQKQVTLPPTKRTQHVLVVALLPKISLLMSEMVDF